MWQLVIGVLCLAVAGAAMVLATELNPVFALVTGILHARGRGARPRTASAAGSSRASPRWWGAPFAGRDVSARLARDHVRTAVRTPVALAAPILAISAIAGSMIVTLSFAADWVTALDREQLSTPYVVETGGDASVGDRLEGLPLADPRITVTMSVIEDGDDLDVDFVDPKTAPEARGMRVVKGDLADLEHGVAVTSSLSFDSGVARRRPAAWELPVVAVVRDAPDLYSDVIAPRSQLPAKHADTVPELYFVDPGSADLDEVVAGTDARVLTADGWIDEVDAQTRAGNNLGLWVLLGPAGLYAAIAIVNSVLVGASQRRAQLRTVALLGATA